MSTETERTQYANWPENYGNPDRSSAVNRKIGIVKNNDVRQDE